MLGDMRGPLSEMESGLQTSLPTSHLMLESGYGPYGFWQQAWVHVLDFFWLLLLGVSLLVRAESVALWASSVVSSLPGLPYFCPEGRSRERSRELECQGVMSEAKLGAEYLQHQDACWGACWGTS